MMLSPSYGLDWAAIALAMAAVALLGSRSRGGFLFFMGSNAAWIASGLIMGTPAIVAGNAVFFVLNLRGWLTWTEPTGQGEGSLRRTRGATAEG